MHVGLFQGAQVKINKKILLHPKFSVFLYKNVCDETSFSNIQGTTMIILKPNTVAF